MAQKPEALVGDFQAAHVAVRKVFGGSGSPETMQAAALPVPSMAYVLRV